MAGDGGSLLWRARIDSMGVLVLTPPGGMPMRVGVVEGQDGKTPKKGVDYFDGKDGVNVDRVEFEQVDTGVVVVATLENGKVFRSPAIRHGRDGYTPAKGKDYRDGVDGKTPVKGVDYFDGEPGKAGVGLQLIERVGNELRARYTDGRMGQVGQIHDGETGADGVGIAKWDWLEVDGKVYALVTLSNGKKYQSPNLRGPEGPKGRMRGADRLGGGGWFDEKRVLELIRKNMTTAPLESYFIADEDSAGNVKYYGYTKNGTEVWYILRVSHSADEAVPVDYRYANVSNNASITSYKAATTGAWAKRATLTYDYLSGLSGL